MRSWPLVILVICWIEVFALEVLLGSNSNLFEVASYNLIALGGMSRGLTFQSHEWWRVITSAYLHLDINHLSLNLVAFLFFGIKLAQKSSPYLVLALFLIGGVFSGFVAGYFQSEVLVSVGASGGILAVVAAEFWMQSLSWADSKLHEKEGQTQIRAENGLPGANGPKSKSKRSSPLHRSILACLSIFFFLIGALGTLVALTPSKTNDGTQTLILWGVIGFVPLLVSLLAFLEYRKLSRANKDFKTENPHPSKSCSKSQSFPTASLLTLAGSFKVHTGGNIDLVAHLSGVLCGLLLCGLFARRIRNYYLRVIEGLIVESKNQRIFSHSCLIVALLPAAYINAKFFEVRPISLQVQKEEAIIRGQNELVARTVFNRSQSICRVGKIAVKNPDLDYPVSVLAENSYLFDVDIWSELDKAPDQDCKKEELSNALQLACPKRTRSALYFATCIRATILSSKLDDAQILLDKLKKDFQYDDNVAEIEILLARLKGVPDLGQLYLEILERLPDSRDIYAKAAAWATDDDNSYTDEFTKIAAKKFPNDDFITSIRGQYLVRNKRNSEALDLLQPLATRLYADWQSHISTTSKDTENRLIQNFIVASCHVALELNQSQPKRASDLIESANKFIPILRDSSRGEVNDNQVKIFEKAIVETRNINRKNATDGNRSENQN